MLTPDIIPINSLRPYILITPDDVEISGSNDEYMQNREKSNENLSNCGLSQIISHAAKEVDLLRQRENERNEIDINDEESKNSSLNECKKQLSFIDIDMVEIETSSTGYYILLHNLNFLKISKNFFFNFKISIM